MPYNDTFEDISKKPQMLEAFRKHLESEHSVENLDFHEAIATYKEKAADPRVSDEELREYAKEIHETFVEQPEGAGFSFTALAESRQVNLSGDTRLEVDERMKSVDTTGREDLTNLFNESDAEVVKMMQADSMRRFQSPISSAIKPAEQRLQQLEAQAQKLQSSRWEQFKAFFSGGTAKKMENIVAEIDKAKMEIMQKTDPDGLDKLQRGKEQMQTKLQRQQDRLAPTVAMGPEVRDAVFKASMDRNFSPLSKEELAGVEELVSKAPAVEGAIKSSESLEKQQKELGKSISVGERLKGQIGNGQAQGQKGPRV